MRVQCRVSPVALMLSPSDGSSYTTPLLGKRAGSRPKPPPRPACPGALRIAGILARGMLWRMFRSLPTLIPPTSLDRLKP
ncbi:hypothetical protein D3C80_1286990 [compost metagenome]